MKNRRWIVLLGSLATGLLSLNAQSVFQRSYGGEWHEIAYSIQQTSDGGFFIVGGSGSFCPGGNDVFVIKTSGAGDTLWSKTYGGTGGDWGLHGKQTPDGGFVVVGETVSFGQGTDILLLKINSNGVLQWAKNYGGTSLDISYGVDLTDDGGFILCGKTFGFGLGNACLIKTNSAGDLEWYKAYGDNDAIGGFSVLQTNDRGYIFLADLVGNSGSYVIKTDSIGNVMWGTQIQANLTYGTWVEQISDNGYLLAGYTSAFGSGFQDAFLCKFHSSGSLQWAKAYGTSSSEFARCVRQTLNGDFIIAGTGSVSGNNQLSLLRTDSNGNLQWSKCYGDNVGADEGYSVVETADGGFAVTGSNQNNTPLGVLNISIFKTDSAGTSGCTDTTLSTITMNIAPSIVFKNPTVTNGTIPNIPAVQSCSTSPHVESLGSPKAYFTFDLDSTLFVNFCDSSVNILSWQWDLGDGTYSTSLCPSHSYADTGLYTVCLTVQNNCGWDSICKTILVPSSMSATEELSNPVYFYTYPSPCHDYFTISASEVLNSNYDILMFDANGRCSGVQKRVVNGTLVINCEGLIPGLYFVQIIKDHSIAYKRKIIIQ